LDISACNVYAAPPRGANSGLTFNPMPPTKRGQQPASIALGIFEKEDMKTRRPRQNMLSRLNTFKREDMKNKISKQVYIKSMI